MYGPSNAFTVSVQQCSYPTVSQGNMTKIIHSKYEDNHLSTLCCSECMRRVVPHRLVGWAAPGPQISELVLLYNKVHMKAPKTQFYCVLPLPVRPNMSRKLHGNTEPNAHKSKHYNIGKVPTQKIIRNRERKQRIRGCRSNCTLNGACCSSEADYRT